MYPINMSKGDYTYAQAQFYEHGLDLPKVYMSPVARASGGSCTQTGCVP